MKKLNKISLHNLSQTEMANREQKMLKGGRLCACVGVCLGDACVCTEAGDTGLFPLSDNNTNVYDGSNSDEQAHWDGRRNKVV